MKATIGYDLVLTLVAEPGMQIATFPFTNVLWSEQPIVGSHGESGMAYSRIVQTGDVSARMVKVLCGNIGFSFPIKFRSNIGAGPSR